MGLAETIRVRWSAAPAAPPITLLDAAGPRPLSGEALGALADRHAAGLAAAGVGAGDRVGLVLPTGEAFLGAFFGAWHLGAAAVPLAPPAPRQDPAHEAARLARALATAQVRVAVVEAPTTNLLGGFDLPLLDAAEAGTGGRVARASGPAGNLALIQFSSGSTGHPRGVCLSEANLLANLEAITAVMQPRPGDVGVAWLPLHHDMGLIGCLLFTQLAGVPLVLMAPEFFIHGPARWLRAMSDYGATMTSAPNFAYHLCAGLPASQTAGLDLSRMRAALVGAEPVRSAALRGFAERYALAGFDPAAFVPTYGLAEATLAVAMTPPGRGMRLDGERISVGLPLPGVSVSVCDEITGQELPDGEVGEIRVRAESVTAGYFGDPEASAEALQDGALRTGDLGYFASGELYIAGRSKDLIIKGGHKYHPQDLEAIAEELAAVRNGGSSAFLVPRAGSTEDRLILVAEVHPQAVPGDLAQEIRRQVQDASGVRLDDVLLVAPQQLPRTTSGKLRRAEARERYLAGAFRRFDA